MPTAISHGIESSRRFSNDIKGKRLTEWLNDPEQDRARNRIRNLIRDLRFLAESWESVDDGEGGAWKIRDDRYKQFCKVARRVIRLFYRYTFAGMVWPFGPNFICQWKPISGPDGKCKQRWPPAEGEYSEYVAIDDLQELITRDVLRLVECRCGRWLFARFSHQRFCSAKCREREFKSSPEWKEYRRRKAREYYRLHKSGKVK